MIQLRDYQLDAIDKLRNGSILCGGVGSGKSLTSLGYYYLQNGGNRKFLDGSKKYYCMKDPQDLIIITTAMKRDSKEWESEMSHFLLSTHEDLNHYNNKVIVDSWNNIGKYSDVSGAFFLFDEQRLIGSGAWVKSFYKIAKKNNWILLSATPGDTWQDYIPVFVANGFYRNKTEFTREHIVYSRFSKFPKIDRYLNTGRLIRLRNNILVDMDFHRKTVAHHEDIICQYDKEAYKSMWKNRWNPWENKPIENASELCLCSRKLVISDESRQVALLELVEKHPRIIIFYNYNFERDILLGMYYGDDIEIAEWNGHAHQPIPNSKKWVYIVQYTSGNEGWNCVKTDTIVFFSENYAYRVMHQAAGRIDRLNTPYKELYYYHMKTKAPIDLGIARSLKNKKKFNEGKFVKW